MPEPRILTTGDLIKASVTTLEQAKWLLVETGEPRAAHLIEVFQGEMKGVLADA